MEQYHPLIPSLTGDARLLAVATAQFGCGRGRAGYPPAEGRCASADLPQSPAGAAVPQPPPLNHRYRAEILAKTPPERLAKFAQSAKFEDMTVEAGVNKPQEIYLQRTLGPAQRYQRR